MHLEGKRLTAKYRASKMFLPPFFGLNPGRSRRLFNLEPYEPCFI